MFWKKYTSLKTTLSEVILYQTASMIQPPPIIIIIIIITNHLTGNWLFLEFLILMTTPPHCSLVLLLLLLWCWHWHGCQQILSSLFTVVWTTRILGSWKRPWGTYNMEGGRYDDDDQGLELMSIRDIIGIPVTKEIQPKLTHINQCENSSKSAEQNRWRQ